MNPTLFFKPSSSPLFFPPTTLHKSQPPYPHSNNIHHAHLHHHSSLTLTLSPRRTQNPPSLSATTPDGTVAVVNFEDLMEKDWSFLEFNNTNNNIDKIISASEPDNNSRVLVSLGSEEFVDKLVEKLSPECELIVIHESLFVLAGIKEKYDVVKCWQGELIDVDDVQNLNWDWGVLDVVFLYCVPGLPFTLNQILQALAKCCLPGARVIISHPEGRQGLEKQRCKYPDVVISELPDKATLQKVASDHFFELAQYVDDSEIYLAVLKYCKLE